MSALVVAIGWKAHAALAAPARRLDTVAALTGSLWVRAGDELMWIGPALGALHPRAVLVRGALPRPAELDRLDVAGLVPWRPAPLTWAEGGRGTLREGAERLARRLGAFGPQRGFCALLAGLPFEPPLGEAAAAAARAFLGRCRAEDVPGLAELALPLLGLGQGLTPAGDDFVGGACFALGLVEPGLWEDGRGAAARDRIVAAARRLTHPVSATLLGDLLEGAGFAALHDVAAALAAADDAGALEAARRLAAIGHSSGWDMLAGMLGALGAV